MDAIVAGRHVQTQAMILPDGRTLSYCQFGPDDGVPFIYNHGAGTGRYEALGVADHAERLGLRIIAPDRPGYGRSTPKPNRTFASWADDVRQLADRLRLERFAVAGVSAGAAHAVGIAGVIPSRTAAAFLINTAGDAHRPEWRAVPLRIRLMLTLFMLPGFARRLVFEPTRRDPARTLDKRPETERAAIAANRAWLVPAFEEGLRQGVDAAVEDAKLLYDRPWDVGLDRVRCPIRIFQGRDDTLITFVRALAAANAAVALTEIPGGHLNGWTGAVWNAIAEEARAALQA